MGGFYTVMKLPMLSVEAKFMLTITYGVCTRACHYYLGVGAAVYFDSFLWNNVIITHVKTSLDTT